MDINKNQTPLSDYLRGFYLTCHPIFLNKNYTTAPPCFNFTLIKVLKYYEQHYNKIFTFESWKEYLLNTNNQIELYFIIYLVEKEYLLDFVIEDIDIDVIKKSKGDWFL